MSTLNSVVERQPALRGLLSRSRPGIHVNGSSKCSKVFTVELRNVVRPRTERAWKLREDISLASIVVDVQLNLTSVVSVLLFEFAVATNQSIG